VKPIEVNGVRIGPELIRSKAALLRQEARATGYEVTPEDGLRFLEDATDQVVHEELVEQEAARQSLTVEQLFDVWCKPVRSPRAKDLRDIYLRHQEQFWAPDSIFVSHIVKNVNHEDERELRMVEMQRVLEILESGADFAATADAHSDCSGNGGRIGHIQRGEMVPEFDDVVFEASIGKITPIFCSRFGVHIALVLESRPAGILSFEEIAPNIERAIIAERRDTVIAERIKQLRERAIVRQVSGI
jgi:peptidyl-prolyl cis-trans isomerase C